MGFFYIKTASDKLTRKQQVERKLKHNELMVETEKKHGYYTKWDDEIINLFNLEWNKIDALIVGD